MTKERWLNDRKAELLPCGYFHLVFTLPHTLNPIVLNNKKIMLAMLFAVVNESLQAFAKDPQWRLNGQLGIIAVLHTWSQTLVDHFHIHCLVPCRSFITSQRQMESGKAILFVPNKIAG